MLVLNGRKIILGYKIVKTDEKIKMYKRILITVHFSLYYLFGYLEIIL